VNFEFLFHPVEQVDLWLEGLFSGAPVLAALGIALVLGLRHASDPDHLVAVTSLVAADGGDTRAATRLGGWWGIGHGLTLLVIGLPLIFFKSRLPVWPPLIAAYLASPVRPLGKQMLLVARPRP